MAQQIITKGNQAVVINDLGRFEARLYVNAGNGLAGADATLVCGKFKTIAGAQRWAAKQLTA